VLGKKGANLVATPFCIKIKSHESKQSVEDKKGLTE